MATPGVILFTSPGVLVDGPGFVVVVGSDGKLHVKPVPGWGPDIMADLTAALTLMSLGTNLKNVEVGRQLQTLGEGIVQSHSKDIQGYIQKLAG